MKKLRIYTDGACKGNPGPGGWGAVLLFNDDKKEIWGGEAQTTNNRMELKAAIEALSAVRERCQIDLHTDSQYVRKGITEWMKKWIKNGWRTASKTPVKNADLWQQLNVAVASQDVVWHWVKGHSGDPLNELADELANRGVAMAQGRG